MKPVHIGLLILIVFLLIILFFRSESYETPSPPKPKIISPLPPHFKPVMKPTHSP